MPRSGGRIGGQSFPATLATSALTLGALVGGGYLLGTMHRPEAPQKVIQGETVIEQQQVETQQIQPLNINLPELRYRVIEGTPRAVLEAEQRAKEAELIRGIREGYADQGPARKRAMRSGVTHIQTRGVWLSDCTEDGWINPDGTITPFSESPDRGR